MGTRGFVGFVANERESIAYVHNDSYPDGLGLKVLEFLQTTAHETPLKDRVMDLVHVSDDVPPTHIQVRELAAKFANLGVSTGDAYEWYVLLRDTQGDPEAILKAGYIENLAEWPIDSLFCEWGYLINTDTQTFEVYEGLQDRPHINGRFAGRKFRDPERSAHGYHPVKLIASYPFTDLPTTDDLSALERTS